MNRVKAVIADDEAELRRYLRSRLAVLWPDLEIVAEAAHGDEALALINSRRPDVVLLDIKMPGLTGLEVVRGITVPCRVVFITAYDRYAVEAFENEAMDYLLKPVTDERLIKTVKRLQKAFAKKSEPAADLGRVMEKIMAAAECVQEKEHLHWIKARHGEGVRLIAVEDVCYFSAEDKYTVVRTGDGEFLIKKSIQELEQVLNPSHFQRIHRATIVNVRHIERVERSFAGGLFVLLKNRPEKLTVSRTYSQNFKRM